MKYTINLPDYYGNVIPIYVVVDAMAKVAASNFGKLPHHHQSYIVARKQFAADLLNAAHNGHLTVCTRQGTVGSIAQILAQAGADDSPKIVYTDKSDGLQLALLDPVFTTVQCLNDWRKHIGDTFEIAHTVGMYVDCDLCDADGKVIVPGYVRGMVGTNELVQAEVATVSTEKGGTTNAESSVPDAKSGQDRSDHNLLTPMKKDALQKKFSAYPKLNSALNLSKGPWKDCRVPPTLAPGHVRGYYYVEKIERECIAKWGVQAIASSTSSAAGGYGVAGGKKFKN